VVSRVLTHARGALLLLCAVMWLTYAASLRAAYYDCDPELFMAVYVGEEVECSGSYPNNACEAFCELCFSSECDEVDLCIEGSGIGMRCVPVFEG
jgi:hypothetical protein